MKRLMSLGIAALCLALTGGAALAQEKFPNRPIKVLVPYAPGGATDIAARLLGDEIQKQTGQSVVVLNKPGAFGVLAIEELTHSPPDGYTLMLGNVSTNAITPIIYAKKLSSDYSKSVVAVSNLVDVPAFLLVTTANDFPSKTVAEFIDYAKKNPGKVNYGTVGIGSYPHYDMAYFAKRAGNLDMAGLPNKNGATGVIQDMLRGDVQAAFLNVASTAGQVHAGKFRALAVVSHARLADFPDVPTMKEVGYPDVGTIAWNGLFAPAATPKPVLDALYRIATQALRSPEVQEKFKKQSMSPGPNKSVADAKLWLEAEMKHWETITQEVKIEAPQ
jgi:tripartite-type tricarboxylate transporter receptor subunit TctC